MAAELHCYDYVNQPFEIVRRSVLADPDGLFRRASGGKLHVKLGGLDLGAEVEIDIGGVTESREAFAPPTTTLSIAWRNRRSPNWFPVMTAKLALYPLSPTETQVELTGTYTPPLGTVDDAVDTVAMKKIAQESVQSFVRAIATHLRKTLPGEQIFA